MPTPESAPAPRSHAPPAAGARSADTVNEEIRALWLRAGGRLSPEQRRRYERLVTEWSAAVRATRTEAQPATPRDTATDRGARAGA